MRMGFPIVFAAVVGIAMAGADASAQNTQPKTHLGWKPSSMIQLTARPAPDGSPVVAGLWDGTDYLPFTIPSGSVFVMTSYTVGTYGPGLYEGYVSENPNNILEFGFDSSVTGNRSPYYNLGGGLVFRSTPSVVLFPNSAFSVSVRMRGYLARDK